MLLTDRKKLAKNAKTFKPAIYNSVRCRRRLIRRGIHLKTLSNLPPAVCPLKRRELERGSRKYVSSYIRAIGHRQLDSLLGNVILRLNSITFG